VRLTKAKRTDDGGEKTAERKREDNPFDRRSRNPHCSKKNGDAPLHNAGNSNVKAQNLAAAGKKIMRRQENYAAAEENGLEVRAQNAKWGKADIPKKGGLTAKKEVVRLIQRGGNTVRRGKVLERAAKENQLHRAFTRGKKAALKPSPSKVKKIERKEKENLPHLAREKYDPSPRQLKWDAKKRERRNPPRSQNPSRPRRGQGRLPSSSRSPEGKNRRRSRKLNSPNEASSLLHATTGTNGGYVFLVDLEDCRINPSKRGKFKLKAEHPAISNGTESPLRTERGRRSSCRKNSIAIAVRENPSAKEERNFEQRQEFFSIFKEFRGSRRKTASGLGPPLHQERRLPFSSQERTRQKRDTKDASLLHRQRSPSGKGIASRKTHSIRAQRRGASTAF